MDHKQNNNKITKEIRDSDLFSSSFAQKFIAYSKVIGIVGGSILLAVILILYYGSKSSEKKLKNMALAASYAEELIATIPLDQNQPDSEKVESKKHYNEVLVALIHLAKKYDAIKERFSGIIAQAILLEPAGINLYSTNEANIIMGDVIQSLKEAQLEEYADFSMVAVFIREKKFEEADELLRKLIIQLYAEKKKEKGLLLAFSLLQQAAVAKELHHLDQVSKRVAELKELLQQTKGSDALISQADADSFLKLVQDKDQSLIDFPL